MPRLLEKLEAESIERTVVLTAGSEHDGVVSDTGWVVYTSKDEQVAIAPPLPLNESFEDEGLQADPLLRQLTAEPTVAIVLVRLGRYAVGVFRGKELIESKTEGRYVGGQHKAGGWSQKRFARIREKQARELYDKVCEVSRQKITPYESNLERLWLGGDRHVLNGFQVRCPWLQRFAERTAEHRLTTPTPDHHGLTKSIDEALSYRVVRLPVNSGDV